MVTGDECVGEVLEKGPRVCPPGERRDSVPKEVDE